jgi:hypothetical protein
MGERVAGSPLMEMGPRSGLAFAKQEPRKRTKGRQLRVESLVKQRVRAACVERDGDCRIATGRDDRRNWTAGYPCSGASEWMHLGANKRARTRGQAPAIRHTTAASCMGCTRHHRDYDAGRLRMTPVSDRGANGSLLWEYVG